jgi:16S rRNA (guanine527-N7)-methyltransferase
MSNDSGLDVSRETLDRLKAYEALIRKWTAKINLVSNASLPDLWERHILDSAQVFPSDYKSHHWADLGSGGGLPGIVIAILAKEHTSAAKTTLVESDQRKAVFLRTVIRELNLNAEVKTQRIEILPALDADVISARALADMNGLLGFCERHLSPTGYALFLKGESWQKEHEIAQTQWSYQLEATTSVTNPAAALLKIRDIKRV